MNWLTIALGVVSGLGVGSWITGLWERRHASWEAEKQRAHASGEARAARRFAIRLEAYKAASHYLSRQEMWISLTEPMLGPAPEAPEETAPDDAWIELGGTIAVSASDAVRKAMQAAVVAQRAFTVAVVEYRRSNVPTARIDPEKNPGLAMHNAREKAIAAIQNAQTVMRDELADL